MQLNHDCIRDVLLYLESNTTSISDLTPATAIANKLSDSYKQDVIFYTIHQLNYAKYISSLQSGGANNNPIFVGNLTWIGHEYLDNIRDKTAWEKLKESGLASMSLDVAKDLIKEIVINLAKSKLGLN